MPFHPVGIPEYKGDADNGQHNPAEEPVFKAREDGQPRNTLGYANGEGVQHGTGKAHMGRHIAHADAYNWVISHGDGKRDEDDDKGNGLFAHAENGTEKTEHDHDKGNDDILHPYPFKQTVPVQFQHTSQKSHHPHLNGTAVVEDVERTTDHEDKDDDVRFVNKTIEECGEDLPGLGLPFHIMEWVVLHHLPYRGAAIGILHRYRLAHILACRHKPSADSCQQDERKDDGKCMRNLFQWKLDCLIAWLLDCLSIFDCVNVLIR